MDITAVIKEIGRGKAGARDLDRATACALFTELLADRVAPLQLGAVLMAMRIKGETVDELAGFLDACHAQAQIVHHGVPYPIVIPSYNGARHTANLVPLLALLLARRGTPVLVHGVDTDEKRVTTREVFAALGISGSESLSRAVAHMAQFGVGFISIDQLIPGLATLLAARWQMGVRSSGHTVVKMLQPLGARAIQLVSVTHPEYLASMRNYYALHPANALLMRGTEGEAVASSKRPQAIEWLGGHGLPQWLLPAAEGSIVAVPDLPQSIDAETTARWIGDVLAGHRPVPPAIARQVDAVVELRSALLGLAVAPLAASNAA